MFPQYPLIIPSKSVDESTFQTFDALAFDPFLYITSANIDESIIHDPIARDYSDYYSQLSRYHQPAEATLQQSAYQSDDSSQTYYLDPAAIDPLVAQPSILQFSQPNVISNGDMRLDQQHLLADSTPLLVSEGYDTGSSVRETEEMQRAQPLLQLQWEIYRRSATILRSDTSLKRGNEAYQNHSGALDRLFDVTEKFIKLLTDTHGFKDHTAVEKIDLQQHKDHPRNALNEFNPSVTETRTSSLKRRASSLGHSGSSPNAILDTRCGTEPLTMAAFHLIMGCHTRLLTAYGNVIDKMGVEASDAPQLSRPSYASSLSTSIPNVKIDKSLLHQLQIISKQLSKLNKAVHAALLWSQNMRQAEHFPRKVSLGGLQQARRSSSPPMLEESAIEIVEQQQSILEMKIDEIRLLASGLQQARRVRTRLPL